MNPQRPSVAKTIDHQAKQIAYNVYSYYKARKMDSKTVEHQQDINLIDTVSTVTGLSKSTVTRIIREGNAMKAGGLVKFLPGNKKHIRKKRIEINEFTEGVIRRKVIQFYTVKREVPSVRKLNALLKEENILDCSNEYLRQLLHNLGFANADNNSPGMIMERQDITSQRYSYLQAIQGFRAEKNRNILYLNDAKLWQTQPNAKTPNTTDLFDLIAVHGGSGFSDGSLVMFKMKSDTINRGKDFNFDHFENYDWVKDTLIPKVSPGSVIVLNTPILNKIDAKAADKKPTLSSTRAAMQDWLKKNNVPFRDTEPKSSLFQLISNLDSQYEYSFDRVLKENGHEVVHLPINHPDLNPVLLALEEFKGSSDSVALTDLFSKLKKEQWQACIDKVVQNENEYYEHDLKFDEAVDSLLSTVKKEPWEEQKDDDIEDDDGDMECEYNI